MTPDAAERCLCGFGSLICFDCVGVAACVLVSGYGDCDGFGGLDEIIMVAEMVLQVVRLEVVDLMSVDIYRIVLAAL